MNILHVVQAYYPFQERGGSVFKVRALAETLAHHGHTVTVLTADLGLAKHPEIGDRVQKYSWGSRLELDGVEVIYLSTAAKYRAMTFNPTVRQFCEKRLSEFAVIHFFGLYDILGPTVSYFARRQRIPYLAEPMGMYWPIDRNLLLKRVWHSVLGKTFLKQAAKIVATSEMEKKEMLDAAFRPTRVLIRYNGVDSNLLANLPGRGAFRCKWNLPLDEPLILFLSRLIPRKGADVLIEAFADACPEKGRLVIAGPEGEPGYRDYLEACAGKISMRERILFTGPIYGEEKKSLYTDADVFVLPSRYENFANVAAEAMVCGVPVILGGSCGISALVKEESAGLVVSPEKRPVSKAIRDLFTDHALYQSLKKGCARIPERLNWSKLAAEMAAGYEAVIREQEPKSRRA